MSVEDKIAKALLTKHAGFLKSAKSDGWFTSIESQLETPAQLEYGHARIMIGEAELECLVASDDQAQIQGLQGHTALGPYEAMIFPYQEPSRVAFHMAEVTFPIDMIFVGDDSRVTRIVENIEPGTPGHWGMPHIVAVVEVNGGFCQAHNIEVGVEVGQIEVGQIESVPKTAQNDDWIVNPNMGGEFVQRVTPQSEVADRGHRYIKNFEESLTDVQKSNFGQATGILIRHRSSKPDYNVRTGEYVYEPPSSPAYPVLGSNNGQLVVWDIQNNRQLVLDPSEIRLSKMHKRISQEVYTPTPRKDINPQMVTPNVTRDRFKDHDILDKALENQPMDPSHFEQEIGYDPANSEEQNDGIGPNVRPL